MEGIERWLGEPVELIIIPSELFTLSKDKSSVVLQDPFIPVVSEFCKKGAHFSVKCNQDDDRLFSYVKCLRKIFDLALDPKTSDYYSASVEIRHKNAFFHIFAHFLYKNS